MCKKQTAEAKRINKEIKRRSEKYYYNNPEVCIKHNFYKRCEGFVKKKKQIWPPLTRGEVEEFIHNTRLPRKFWKNKKLW